MVVCGLDGAEPSLVFGRFRSELPNLSKLAAGGISGPLTSVIPAITVPAWACGLAGKDPGQLGIYGFRNRKDYSYGGLTMANSMAIKEALATELLARHGKKIIMQGVPPAYPPRPTNGVVIGCFLTPDATYEYTYPRSLRKEIRRLMGEYPFDVKDFRTDDKQCIADQVYEMTRKHFQLFRYLLRSQEWDFAMMHEIGLDRIHHGFWKYMDETHPKHEPGSPFKDVIRQYYRFLDREVGALLEDLGDGTDVLVMSDHGAQKMWGGICVNEWLMREGLLALKEVPTSQAPFDIGAVDWSRTKAWGEGGYYARIFLNVEGREPQGIVRQGEYEELRQELIRRFEAITDEQGLNIGTRAFRPQDIYRRCGNVPPDLIVYFGDLSWRSIGSVGLGSIYTYENDAGSDDSNHAQDGLFIMTGDHIPAGEEVEGTSILQIGPTILSRFGLPIPADIVAQPIV